MLLELGAASVTTLEYNDIDNSVENVKIIKPSHVKRMWKERSDELNFDVIVTFSSIEHSGMGRYGDPLNPWGDLIASARAWYINSVMHIYLLEVAWNPHHVTI